MSCHCLRLQMDYVVDHAPPPVYKLSGTNGDRENSVFLVPLTTSRIGNHTRLMSSLLKVMTTHCCFDGYSPCHCSEANEMTEKPSF